MTMRNEDKCLAYCDKKRELVISSLAFLHLNELGGVAVCPHPIALFIALVVTLSRAFFPVHLRLLPPAEK